MSSHAHGPLHSECQNCATPLQGPHCHQCGQRDFDFHRSFGHVVHEAIETWFHFDGSFFRGFYDLLFRPGRMTRDFNEGKRARHVPPFRFYLVLSLVFFFVFSLGARDGDAFTLSDTGTADPSVYVQTGFSSLDRSLNESLNRAMQNPGPLRDALVRTLPKMMLVCLPLFALYSFYLYRRSGWVYLQHLILAIHVHSFVYLLILVTSGWGHLLSLVSPRAAGILRGIATFYVGVHLFLTLRHCFRGPWLHHLGKTIALGWAYLFTLLFAGIATVLIALSLA